MDRIALAVVIGTSLVFGCGVLVGVVFMVSTTIRRIRPVRAWRRTRPQLPGTGPDDREAGQSASRGGR
jgi:hypothetical protein